MDEDGVAGGVVPVNFPDAAGRGGDGGSRLHRRRRGGAVSAAAAVGERGGSGSGPAL